MTSRSEVACRATWLASRVVPRLVAKPSSTPISESQGRLAASSPGRGGVCAGVNGVGELARAVTRKMQCSGRSAEHDLIMEEATSGNCPTPIFALSFVFAGAGDSWL
jgi:hypothetical protein